MNPEQHSITKIDWQFFSSLTFKSDKLSDSTRIKIFFATLRSVAEFGKVHFSQLLWVLRAENGDTTGRLHFHALIAGLPVWMLQNATCFSIMKTWEKQGGGIARVSVFANGLDGVGYVLKGLSDEAKLIRVQKDHYEATKFGGACTLMISKSLVTMLSSGRLIGNIGPSNTLQSGVISNP